MTQKINIPETALVILIGSSSSGKSTFAAKHFAPHEIVSSDYCRTTVSGSEYTLDANQDTFELLHYIVDKRLKRGLLTVVDATNVQSESRKALLRIARQHHVLNIGIVLNMSERLCNDRNKVRTDRDLKSHVIRHQQRSLKNSFRRFEKEGFGHIYEFKSPEQLEKVTVNRTHLYNNLKSEKGAFDIIGDVHGCFVELKELLVKLGYKITKHRDKDLNFGYTVKNPTERKAIFVGDLVDRGPASNEVLRLVMSMVKNGQAFSVNGNHDDKLKRKLNGRDVKVAHGLAETLEQLANEPKAFIQDVKKFLRGRISHYVFDDGKLVVAHAGLPEAFHGRASGTVRSFAMYGETTGETDEFGMPVRYLWAKDYEGKAMVVYGHTAVTEAVWLNNTIDVDTGCVFGGKLTALQYPTRKLVSVQAKKIYAESTKPLAPLLEKKETTSSSILELSDIIGPKRIETQLGIAVNIHEEQSLTALETISRFAVHPNLMVYLPPTMSPAEVSDLPDFLEHPKEAFEYYRKNGITKVICEEKHMGSRAVIVVGKNAKAIETHFEVKTNSNGKIYTRTGRPFFSDKEIEKELLERLSTVMTKTDFWEKHKTDWAILDCELMPWSAKAQSLIKNQYAAVGAAAEMALPELEKALDLAAQNGFEISNKQMAISQKVADIQSFKAAYQPYCWEIKGIEDYKIAPFHLLATENAVHTDKSHAWHMENLHEVCAGDPDILLATKYRILDLSDAKEEQECLDWWLKMTATGGEGMVVKPFDFVARNEEGRLLQPAIKCRGKEYLRLIYGADYLQSENLSSLKNRRLGKKRSLAMREFVLGEEALQRFVQKANLSKVHECVVGITALTSEWTDPRL